MIRRTIVAPIFLPLGLAACAGTMQPEEEPGVPTAAATLLNAQGRPQASVVLTQTPDGVRVAISAAGMAPGPYGAHVHTTGRCDPPDFASAGGHWNPTGRKHGKENPQGMHKGDLPNLLVGTDGSGTLEYVISGTSLSGGQMPMVDSDGAAIVLHAGADDYRTDPAGNSGGRIACGVVG